MKYYVIYSGEDGVNVEVLTKDELEERLADHYWGEEVKFLTTKDDLRYYQGIMIIKGEMIQPKPKQVVQAWEV